MLSFALSHYAVAAALALVCVFAGANLLRRVETVRWSERLGLSLALGLGAGGSLLFLLGVAGLFRPAIIVPALGVFAAAGALVVWKWLLEDLHEGAARAGVRLALVVGALGVGCWLSVDYWLSPLYPPTRWDGISYHLAVSKAFLLEEAIVTLPYLRFPVFPQVGELWFAVAMALQDDVTAKLTQFAAFLGCGVLLYGWAAREENDRTAVWASALWLASPLAVVLAGSAYIDVFLTLFVCAAAYAGWRAVTASSLAWAGLCGLLAGSAAGTKYSGLIFGALLLAWIVWHLPRAVRWRGVGLFVAAWFVTGGIWFLRSWLVTGDPLFPFLPEIFGHSYWSPEDVAAQKAELRSHGIGRGLLDSLRFWIDLSWNQGFFLGESLSSLALLIPLPILFALRWKSPRARYLAWLTLPFALVLFFQSQIMRYLLPVFPFLCLEMASLLDRALAFGPLRESRSLRLALGAVLAGAIAWSVVDYAHRDLIELRGPLPTDERARRTYLTQNVPPYGGIDYLNREYGAEYRLYALHAERGAYFADGLFMGDWFGPARLSLVKPHLADRDSLHQAFDDLGIGFLLVTNRNGEIVMPDDPHTELGLTLLYADSLGVRVYRRDVPDISTP